MVSEARDSVVLPAQVESESIEVEEDTVAEDGLAERVIPMMVSMLATSTSIEECATYARE